MVVFEFVKANLSNKKFELKHWIKIKFVENVTKKNIIIDNKTEVFEKEKTLGLVNLKLERDLFPFLTHQYLRFLS
jgi:hypothetical protein